MKLDTKIKEGYKPLDRFDHVCSAELDSDIEHLEEVLQGFKGCKECEKDHERLLSYMQELKWYRDNSSESYSENCLNPVEKKYRPFSLEEFLQIFDIGDLVEFRVKNSDELKCAMFTGYITDCERIDDKTLGHVRLC